MDSIQDSVVPMDECETHTGNSSDSGDAGPSDNWKEHPEASLMSLPVELLLLTSRYLYQSQSLVALTHTSQMFYCFARNELYNPQRKSLIKSIKRRMRKAIKTGNEVGFNQMLTHVNTPWSAVELARAITLKQESMALSLLANESIKRSVVQVTTAKSNSSHPFIRALVFAVVNRMHDLLRVIFQVEGINPNVRCSHGGNLLHKYPKDVETRRVLLEGGVDARLIYRLEHTTLRYALRDAASFELLLNWGVRPSIDDLLLAQSRADIPVLEVILRWDLDFSGAIWALYDELIDDWEHPAQRRGPAVQL